MNNDDRYSSPPKLPPKSIKKKFLRGPLIAIKNALIKSTKQLRRQNSMNEGSEKQSKFGSNLRRQHSMMEQRSSGRWKSPEPQYSSQQYYDERNPRYNDQYYDEQRNYMNHQQMMYDDYENRSRNYYDPEQENLYANRASIEFERKAHENANRMQYHTNTGSRIVRRHSMADRSTRAPSRLGMQQNSNMNDADRIEREDIYQTRSGAFMMQQTNLPAHRQHQPSNMMQRTQNRDDEPIYQSRRDMHLDHLYQSKKEMQQRIHQGRLEVERSAQSESPSASSSTATTPIHSDHASSSPSRELIYQSRRELKEKGFKTRTQLRDHIYQTRREALDSMAEQPLHLSLSSTQVEIQRHKEPVIYEGKEIEQTEQISEKIDEAVALATNQNSEENSMTESPQVQRITNRLITPIIANQSSCNSSGLDDDDTINSPNQSALQKTVLAANQDETNTPESDSSQPISTPEQVLPTKMLSPRADRAHLSNIIKRVAPPSPKPMKPSTKNQNQQNAAENFHVSRTSMETQYTSSQLSLPIGPPNAQSTPYASDVALENAYPPLREQTTTRGIFDENGGTLCDNVWNVSINIPSGAIPTGVQQEIYFTVTDPRMSQTVVGPPLDMENGWCLKMLFTYLR